MALLDCSQSLQYVLDACALVQDGLAAAPNSTQLRHGQRVFGRPLCLDALAPAAHDVEDAAHWMLFDIEQR